MDDPRCWKKIWDLNVISKVQHFMWKVVHGILPTCINLISHFVDVSQFCKHCEQEIETGEHALLDCY